MITDAIGRAVAFILAPGQAHEGPHAVALLDQLPDVPGWVVADWGQSRRYAICYMLYAICYMLYAILSAAT